MKIHQIILVLLILSNVTTAAKYQSKKGSCICGKKTQKGEPFLQSSSYEYKFNEVFGIEPKNGDICSACCRVISHWREGDPNKYEVSLCYKRFCS